jgi:putative membrane protein
VSTEPAGPSTEWHRLHPATPLLRGGIVVIAILGFLIVQFRDLILGSVIGSVVGEQPEEDPLLRWFGANTLLAVGAAIVIIGVIIGIGWLSWRMHAYRVTDELVEEREGILWRRHRRGRLDRVQGVDIGRPFFARLFGAARIEVSMAGSDGSIRLAYVSSARADSLRAEILSAATARRRFEAGEVAAAPVVAAAPRGIGDRISAKANEFLAPELDQPVVEGSLVSMHPGRLVGATALRLGHLLVLILVGAILAAIYRPFLLVVLIPIGIGIYGLATREVLRSLRYSIASTPDGIRIGFGLLSTANETLPPGRVHAIELQQPLLWRPFGWWRVRINRASNSGREGAGGQVSTTILPVGTADEVLRVVGLIVPEWVIPASFTTSPSRGRWFRWFSWRRNGFAFDEHTVVVQRGQFWRTLTLVPLARVQSVAVEDGPLTRAVRLARVEVHTVAGIVRAHVGALDADDAVTLWRETEARTLGAMA